MILDARDLPPHLHELETDLCIIGSGAAALVIAHELLSSGARITLLESGGLVYDEASQELNAGRLVGAAYEDLRSVRRRQVGGTVNSWNTPIDDKVGGKYAPLEAIDFERRDGLPYSGWPFGADELQPWYRKAQSICGLGPFAYDAREWVQPGCPAPLQLDEEIVATKVYQLGAAASLLDAPIAALRASGHAQLLQHATVTELVTGPRAERVSAAVVAVPGRREPLRVRTDTFVLAAGAIENARLLLLSDGARREGLGNEHGWVGRCFMEHPRDYALTLLPARPTFLEEAGFYDQRRTPSGGVIMGRLAIAAAALRATCSLQASATMLPAWPAPSMLPRALRRVERKFKRGHDEAYPRGAAGWSRRPAPEPLGRVRLLLNLEQAPNPDNRIVLASKRDGFGRHRSEVHWTWSETEHRQLQRTRRLFADALESAGYGAVQIEVDWRPDPNAHHHAGTTRMHVDPRCGVVDADSRVHGVENLFIAGASVFPTAGFANPTLTIVALAARLADHLRRRFSAYDKL